jgi:hypothetical protein
VRLLHRDHVVTVERFRGIGASQLFIQGQQLLGGYQLVLGRFVHVRSVGAIEREPNGERQKVAERERGFVERPTQSLCHVAGERRLGTFETLEGVIELGARLFVVVSQLIPYRLERLLRYGRIRGDWANGRTTNPHDDLSCSTADTARGGDFPCPGGA